MFRLLIILLVAFSSFTALAAKPSGLSEPSAKPEITRLQNTISQTQELLKDLGFYEGDVDGFMGSDLEAAINAYQKEHGIPQTGDVSPELIGHLENIGRVRTLILRLDDVREQRQEKARQVLLSDPRTRKLLDKPADEIADPTRDVRGCFKNPTSGCLLREAVESSRAIFEDDMRDWALGEILASQVSVGLDQAAMKTAARIKDSRLIIAALTNIAKTHVKEGKIAEAMTSLALIPVTERRLSVLLDIAENYSLEGEDKKLVENINKVLEGADTIDSFEDSIPIQIQAAEILATVEKKRALKLLDQLSEKAGKKAKNGSKVTLQRHAASAMANIGYPEWALKAVEKMPDDDTRVPILMAAARAFLKAGRFEAARQTIERIAAERYRSVILADLAKALWDAKKHEDALAVTEEARLIASAIRLPFAKNFSYSSIAQTLIHIASRSGETSHADRAFDLLESITDDRLKARGLWNLAHAASTYQFSVSDGNLDDMATQAMREIKSKFSRVWVLGDLVELHQLKGAKIQARRAFEIGLETLRGLKNPWARSRALAKFGALVHRLD